MNNSISDLTARQLASRHAQLMEQIENLPPGTGVSFDKKEKIKALEEELLKRLYRNLSSDVLPIVSTFPSKAKLIERKMMIPFNFEVFSSLNVRVDRFKIEASTKEEAWKEAKKKALKYPGNINLKIS